MRSHSLLSPYPPDRAPNRDWREKQQVEIQERDKASKARREETIAKAERSIDEFYENYAKKKERNIRDNKYAYPSILTDPNVTLFRSLKETKRMNI